MGYIDYFNVLSRNLDYKMNFYRLPFLYENDYYKQDNFSVEFFVVFFAVLQ